MKFHHELEASDRFVSRFSSEYGFFGTPDAARGDKQKDAIGDSQIEREY
jgi:hypothetical protein